MTTPTTGAAELPEALTALATYMPDVVIEENRGRLTATGAAMIQKDGGKWVRLSDVRTLVEALRAQPANRLQNLTREQAVALREGYHIPASDLYFRARPQIDSNDRRKVFEAGFESGWVAQATWSELGRAQPAGAATPAAPALATQGRVTQAGHDLLMAATLASATLVSKGRLIEGACPSPRPAVTAGAVDALRTAAQAVVDRWDTPLWKDAPATAEYIGMLRAALAAQRATHQGDHK